MIDRKPVRDNRGADVREGGRFRVRWRLLVRRSSKAPMGPDLPRETARGSRWEVSSRWSRMSWRPYQPVAWN